jgi:hypothetical protein
VVRFVEEVRRLDLNKSPGVAETLDWAQALMSLGASSLNPGVVEDTLGCVSKSMEDTARIRAAGIEKVLAGN